MKPSTLDLLLDVIDQGFDRQSWHGPNLRGAIRGLNLHQALWRPADDRHNIWEHVLHAAYWKYTVRRRILGEKRGSFPLRGSNWMEVSDPTEAGWRSDLRLLTDTHKSMRAGHCQLVPSKTDAANQWIPRNPDVYDLRRRRS